METARAAGERMGKRVIVARDGPGFLANRCARPFGMEALKLLAENVADHATIDRVVRMGGGFRMGPFELADLVGIDVGFEVTKSFWEQSFHEPRWRPSMIQARMVQAGRFGRKAGRGYYDYSGRRRIARTTPTRPPRAATTGVVVVAGEGRLADDLRDAAADAGYEVLDIEQINGDAPDILIDAVTGRSPLEAEPTIDDPETLVLALCVDGSLAELDTRGGAVGFHALPPLAESRLVELTRSSETRERDAGRAEAVLPLARQARRMGRRRARASCWGGSCASSSTRRPSRCPRASARPRTSTSRCAPATTIRAARSSGPTRSRSTTSSSTLDSLYEELKEERYRACAAAAPDGRRGRDRRGDRPRVLQLRGLRSPLRTSRLAARQPIRSTPRRRTARRCRSSRPCCRRRR